MIIVSYNNEFVIINNIPVRKKDIRISYSHDKVGFSNIFTESLVDTPKDFTEISINGIFYNNYPDLARALADAFTTVVGGIQGVDGRSAYEVAVANGYIGNEASWLLSLKGDNGTNGIDGNNGIDGINGTNGVDGLDGKSAYEIAVINGYVGSEVAWLASLQGANGNDGLDGNDGVNGDNGIDGTNGISAYQVAVNNGFVGTESAWLLSLQGPSGNDGTDGVDGTNGLTQMQIEGLI